MRYLRLISFIILGISIALIALSAIADLDSVCLLAGIMLLWAGIVKLAVVTIWERVAGMGSGEHNPTPAP